MEWTNAEAVRIFPNPAESYFVLSNLQAREGDRVELLDPLGRSVYQLEIGKMDGKSLRVQPGSELPSGVYWVRLGDTLLGQLQWK
ncbi:MAG: T9SS type A sorting domain-containing protein [Saprospiraceae bacterium]